LFAGRRNKSEFTRWRTNPNAATIGRKMETRSLPAHGMNPPVPEVTVLIHKITKNRRAGEYQLHIMKVLGFKHWDKRRQKPKS
jgi:hypothetical protein